MSSKASFFSRLQASATSSPLRTLVVSATVLSTATAVYLLARRLRLQRIESRSTAPPSARPTSRYSTGDARKRGTASSSSSSTSLHSSGNSKEEGEKKDAEEGLDADSIFIYFGTQTGTAESYSEELASAILEEVEGVKRVPVIDLEVGVFFLLYTSGFLSIFCALLVDMMVAVLIASLFTCTYARISRNTSCQMNLETPPFSKRL